MSVAVERFVLSTRERQNREEAARSARKAREAAKAARRGERERRRKARLSELRSALRVVDQKIARLQVHRERFTAELERVEAAQQTRFRWTR
jgi:hypothetical protein